MSGSMALLLSLSLGGSILALLVLGLRLLLGRRLPSSFYYYAWLLVLLRLVLPIPGFLGLGAENEAASLPIPSSQYSYVDSAPRDVRVGDLPEAEGAKAPADPGTVGFIAASGEAAEALQSAEAPTAERLRTLFPSLAAAREALFGFLGRLVKSPGFWLGLWAAGTLLNLAWHVGGYLRFSRVLRRSLRPAAASELRQFRESGAPRQLRLLRSSAIGSPILMGPLRPVLVLPEREYTREMLGNIFLHELTHYRRGDLILKWFALMVTALHWFNPIVHIARRELDRACEMSCDERLLRRMDSSGKRSYGETLLSLADSSSLSRRLVATSFATEKRNLRERLEQIMKYKPLSRAGLALLLTATLLLCGCAAALGPGGQEAEAPAGTAESAAPETAASPSPVPTPEPRSVTVSTVDELLSAIAPNTTITLTEGFYDLSLASDFGVAQEGYYTWVNSFDGPELVISRVSGLSLVGEGEVTISAVPRYADVLTFSGCTDICLAGLTLGHTEAPGECVGGVVDMTAVDSAIISQCKLFGCGVIGVRSQVSTGIQVVESEIYDCSYSAAQIYTSLNVVFNNCKIYDNETFSSLFYFSTSENCAVINCEISGNSSPVVLDVSYSPGIYFAGNIVENNPLSDGMFFISGSQVTVEGCSFGGNGGAWYASRSMRGPEGASLCPVDGQGNELSESRLQSMEHFTVEGWEPAVIEASPLPVSEDGYIHVSNVDEFLAAIGPNSSIYLEDGTYDLSTASSYGGYGSSYYVWKNTGVDGPQLVICNLRGLSITGGGADKVTISAEPRYAEVLAFDNCRDIELSGFTAGHTQEPGSCRGGVLYFNESSNVKVSGCSLYGCGVWGVTAIDSSGIAVKDTEIYDCSSGDINLSGCRSVSFENCDIHDNGLSRIVSNCQQVTMDGEPLVPYSLPKYNELQCVFVVEPGVTLPDGMHIYYSVTAVKELSLPAGTPIELSAGLMVSGQGSTALEEVNWSVSDESKLSLEPKEHGACVVENLGSTGGSVTVTAEYEGQTAQVKINFVKELVNPASYSGSQGSTTDSSANAVAPPTPTPSGNTLRITYSGEERTELTLNAGGQSVALSALGLPEGAKVTWSIQGDDKGEYCTVDSTGDTSCQLTPLKAKSGGVTLVAEYDGMVKTCAVYLLPALK